MVGYIVRRLAQAVVTMAVAVCLIFIAVRVLPGNPAFARFGMHSDPQQIAELRTRYGWDRPIVVQLAEYCWNLLRTGDLGESLTRSNERVADALRQRVPATIELTMAAMAVALPAGLLMGIAAGLRRGTWIDNLCVSASTLGVSVPVFFLGICLRALFPSMPPGARLPLFVVDFDSVTGLYLIDTLLRGRVDLWIAAMRHLCLPALALSTIPMAIIARVTRSSILEVRSSDYVRTARAKGASSLRVVLHHILPNASVPIANIAGLQVGLLLSGAVLTETVFDWPGIGKYVVDALLAPDYVIVQAGAIVVAAIFVSLNLLLDLMYLWLDPRLRHMAYDQS